MSLLAHNLGRPVGEVWSAFDRDGTRNRYIAMGIRNIVRGKTLNSKGEPYNPSYSNGVWDGLIRLCRDPELRALLERRQGDEGLCNRLFGNEVVTLTGRIRGGVSYSQCRNTPFQGLAADGAKLGLWRLIREGYRVIAFVHDEVLVELPDEGGYVSRATVDRITGILCTEMQSVLGGDLPVDVRVCPVDLLVEGREADRGGRPDLSLEPRDGRRRLKSGHRPSYLLQASASRRS